MVVLGTGRGVHARDALTFGIRLDAQSCRQLRRGHWHWANEDRLLRTTSLYLRMPERAQVTSDAFTAKGKPVGLVSRILVPAPVGAFQPELVSTEQRLPFER